MKKCFFLVLAMMCMVSLTLSSVVMADPAAEKAAIEAVDVWLVLIDEEKYAESWEAASDFFKSAVPKEKWVEMLNSFQKPLGKKIACQVKSAEYTTSLPGAPDGEYVVIQYEAQFGKKKSAILTVTPVLEKDGLWKVSGYYIK